MPSCEHAQQLRLQRRGHLGDLVEEERAAVGQLEAAQPPLGGAGEGAALVAEQLALDERLGDGRAVEGDERLLARSERSWSARATSSLPVPVSPWTSTGAVLVADSSIQR